MDGSVEGDIPELSYSPIVVAVYLVWVGRTQLYLLTFLSPISAGPPLYPDSGRPLHGGTFPSGQSCQVGFINTG